MRLLIYFSFLIFAIDSCIKPNDVILETFDRSVSKSNKLVIGYNNHLRQSTINGKEQTANFRKLIKESDKSKDCYNLDGTIVFYEDSLETGRIGFGLNSPCPSFYIYIDGKPITYKMSPYCIKVLELHKIIE